ncbi:MULTISPECIES: TolC family protein [unclassified Oceanobacter]|uniref:TolC family protein n=1 Tax=unclassified Oceanobacter TaxID=2620260 RepID=UPI0027323997|nr:MULTISPECIES: TolC family protein [unclassified Oceanobacter]MDP2548996.1 TolC family protein [Oceanobacter sp. 4_MG-2023]MDP2609180.1 TolC family protein [Oceanobacter sp. 1_MG-2023]MDP2612528.1 TolC family protein [Oceanobacter sp. 2_MG-2023]
MPFPAFPLPLIPRTARLLPVMLLAGCASLSGEQQAVQQTLMDEQASVQQWQATPVTSVAGEEAVESNSLLALLPDEQLTQLVKQSLAANPGLQQTWLTLQVLRSSQLGVEANQLPEADLSLSGSRSEDDGNSFTTELSVSWELDLWARLADSSSAAAADVAEQLALYQSARDTQVAEVMSSWLQLIQLNNAIQVQALLLDSLRKNEDAIIQRYRRGVGDLDDLDSARSSLASAESTQADNYYQLAAAKRSLRTLLGRVTDTAEDDAEVPIPADYPAVLLPLVELPEQTLARRPDLQAAWQALQAADLRTQVAYKDMLPSLSISAALSDTATSPSSSLLTDPVWSLLGQLTAPLFRGGELKAAARTAELNAAVAAQSYRETLLTAVVEVENALDQEATLARQQEAIQRALESARANETRYVRRYRSGLVDMLDLLSVQQSRYSLEDTLNTLTYQRLSNRITLGLALGLPGTVTLENLTASPAQAVSESLPASSSDLSAETL